MPTEPTPRSTAGPRPAHRPPWWARRSRLPLLSPDRVRHRTLSGFLGMATLSVVVALGLLGALRGTEVAAVEAGPGGSFAYRQSLDALVGGCGPRYVFPDSTLAESGTVPSVDPHGVPQRVQYRTTVPIFGHFWTRPMPPGQQTNWGHGNVVPVPERLLHNQWRGDLVVYYTDTAPAADVARLRQMATDRDDLRLVVAPWPTERGTLPGDRKFGFAVWNATQTCHRFVAAALDEFRRHHPSVDAPGADGARPPAASVSVRGSAIVGSAR